MFILAHEMARANAVDCVRMAPNGYSVTVMEPTKRRIQEEKYHAMIGEIAEVVPFMTQMQDEETWKRLLVDAFVRVMREEARATGKPDPFEDQARIVPSLDGSGVVQLGVQTRRFTVAMAAQFIEYLYSFGSENNVIFGD